jgi:salicylate hydroxylase
MAESSNFRVALIGSGPIGKLIISSVAPHPRIEYVQFEAETLPLRPSFGYGIGPQTLTTTMRLNPAVGKELRNQCIIGPVWMNFRHGGDGKELPTIETPQGEYGRIGREELLELLDSFAPSNHEIQYGKKLKSAVKQPRDLKLEFEDGTEYTANAVWGCDGMNSLCRKLVQGAQYEPATYSGMVVFRNKVDSRKITDAVGKVYAAETHMFIGIKGWHILTFPIAYGKFLNIAAFAVEEVQKKRGREYKTSTDELLSYFPGASSTVQTLLRVSSQVLAISHFKLIQLQMLNDEPGGCVCLELMSMETLGTFYNTDLCMTTFGDAANGMLPHIAGSMSTGFIGVTTFVHDEFNPRIESLEADANDAEIAGVFMKASAAYETRHRPLAQKLVDYSVEQGSIFSGAVLDVDRLSMRPKFLWQTVKGI